MVIGTGIWFSIILMSRYVANGTKSRVDVDDLFAHKNKASGHYLAASQCTMEYSPMLHRHTSDQFQK